jgi:hypothetical protein
MDQAIHRRVQVVAENADIGAVGKNSKKMTVPHTKAVPVICASLGKNRLAIAIEYGNHASLDRVVRKLETIAHA